MPRQEPCELAAFLGDETQLILRLTRVPAAWRKSEVVGQATWPGESSDGANATRQTQTRIVTHARGGHQNLGGIEYLTWFAARGNGKAKTASAPRFVYSHLRALTAFGPTSLSSLAHDAKVRRGARRGQVLPPILCARTRGGPTDSPTDLGSFGIARKLLRWRTPA